MKEAKDSNELSDAAPGRRGAHTLGVRLPLCMGMTGSLWLGKERSVQIPQIHTHKLETRHRWSFSCNEKLSNLGWKRLLRPSSPAANPTVPALLTMWLLTAKCLQQDRTGCFVQPWVLHSPLCVCTHERIILKQVIVQFSLCQKELVLPDQAALCTAAERAWHLPPRQTWTSTLSLHLTESC